MPLALLLTKEAPGLELPVRPLTLELPAALARDAVDLAVDLAVVPDLRQLPGSPVPDLSRFSAACHRASSSAFALKERQGKHARTPLAPGLDLGAKGRSHR